MKIPQKKKILVDGVEVFYYDIYPENTDQPPLLFLHGWNGSAESFIPLVQELCAQGVKRRCLVLDFPGFGSSALPPTPWTIHDYAGCVVKYLGCLSLSSVSLIVHSFGGRIATVLATSHPELIQNIAYIAPAGIRHNKKGIARIATVLKTVCSVPGLRVVFPLIRTIGYKLIGDNDYHKSSGVMKETFKLVTSEDLVDILPQVKCPVTIFWGVNDSYVPISDTDIMKKAIPHATIYTYDDGRHGIHKTHAVAIASQLVSSRMI